MDRKTEKELLTTSDLRRMKIDCELEKVVEWHNKLSQLEDIEEEIGVDLITLLKQPYCTIFIKKHHIKYGKETNIDVVDEHTLCSIIPQEKCIVVTLRGN